MHNFNRVPWAPLGTRATISNPLEIRSLWGLRAIDAWYIGSFPQHYQNWRLYVPSTGGIHTSGQANFYPRHVELPKVNVADEVRQMAHDLTTALLTLRHQTNAGRDEHVSALKRLTKIFSASIELTVPEDHLPSQSSSNPMVPAQLQAAPRPHVKRSRANTPGMLPKAARTLPLIPMDGRSLSSEGGQGESPEGRGRTLASSEGGQEVARGEYAAEHW